MGSKAAMTERAGAWSAPTDAAARPRPDLVRRIVALVVVGGTYYLGAQAGLTLSLVERNVTPLWPPTGIALAAFLLLGRTTWPGVALAALAVNLPISSGPLAAAVTALGNTAAPLLAATLLHRVGFRPQLDRRRDVLALVFLAALGSMLLSATVGAGTLRLSGTIPPGQLASTWAVWWTGDAMGVLVLTPFLLSLPRLGELRSRPVARWAETVAVLALVTAVATWAALSSFQLLFLVLPFMGWAAWRLQLQGAAPAALIATLVVTWSAAHQLGPFAAGSLFERMFTLQAFNVSVALTSFFAAAVVSERNRDARRLAAATDALEDRVERRTAELSAANARLVQEIQERAAAQEQLTLQEARAWREHRITETLQRSMLPDRMPEIPGVEVAARYIPAAADVQVGGDWYDVIPLRDGMIGLAIGDVAGHGLPAASTMGQLRMALRAYAMQEARPTSVMAGLHQLVSQSPAPELVTLLYMVFDPATRRLSFSNAGHPPALVVNGDRYEFLCEPLSPPLGVLDEADFAEGEYLLPGSATLVLYTDGLVERRGVSIQEGLDRLALEALDGAAAGPAALSDHLLAALLDEDLVADDVALVVLQPTSSPGGPLRVALPAEARMLVEMRGSLRRWLRQSGISREDENEILVAAGEALSNVVQHAYPEAPGEMVLSARLASDSVELVVEDRGAWHPDAEQDGGWGLRLMYELMDSVEVEHTAEGTAVRMVRRVRGSAGHRA